MHFHYVLLKCQLCSEAVDPVFFANGWIISFIPEHTTLSALGNGKRFLSSEFVSTNTFACVANANI